MRCDRCGCKINDQNCTLITGTCDSCLADQAAEDRDQEIACTEAVVVNLN